MAMPQNQILMERVHYDILKLLVSASWQRRYIPIDPKSSPQLCLDMTYPPAQFDVDWSKETQTSGFSKLLQWLHYDIS